MYEQIFLLFCGNKLISSSRSSLPLKWILALLIHCVIDGRAGWWEGYFHFLYLDQELGYSHMVLEQWNQRIYIFRSNWQSIYGKGVKSDRGKT